MVMAIGWEIYNIITGQNIWMSFLFIILYIIDILLAIILYKLMVKP